MNGAQIVCESLIKEGAEFIFGIPGASTLLLYDTFAQYPKLHHVLVRHEQGAAHMADGFARASGKVGVCLTTSGPGATNLVTGIANAHMDSSPIVAISGQVATPLIGRDAFQEADITGMVLPVTKMRYQVWRTEELARVIKEAFYIARTGRPGPVLIDIPRDVFQGEAEFNYPAEEPSLPGYKPGDLEKKYGIFEVQKQIEKAAALVEQAHSPVILAGQGIIFAGAYAEVIEFAEKTQTPVAATLLGLAAFPQNHSLHLGMMGMHGQVAANLAVSNADLLVAIGMRFDDRATGNVGGFAPQAKVIHIDIDPVEIEKNVRVDAPVAGDVKKVLESLNSLIKPQTHAEWLARIERWRQDNSSVSEDDRLLSQRVIRQISDATEGKAIVVTGVGQHQMWVAQNFVVNNPRNFITSGGLGTMGFGLPAAIGAKLARPNETVWLIDGDGSFQMTMHELAVIVQEKLTLKMAIINNGYLGMVRQWQELFYGRRYTATPLLNPDFVKIAQAYGIPGCLVSKKEETLPAIRRAIEYPGSFLIDFQAEPEENVYPMVPSGGSLTNMLQAPKREEASAQ